jgi:membrane protein
VRLKPPRLLAEWVREIGVDRVPRLAAALAYFGIFALPGLLVLILAAAGSIYGFESVEARIRAEFGGLAGKEGEQIVREMLAHADPTRKRSILASVVEIVALVFGATGFLVQLQDALNTMWGAQSNRKRNGFLWMLVKRLFSLGMILVVAVLLVLSLALSAGVTALVERTAGPVATVASEVARIVLAIGLGTLLFATVYKVIPDLRIEWREVWVGAAVTSALLVLGGEAIRFYLGRSDPGASYGAAAPLAIVLVWIYYSTLILLVGAEFTQVYARLHGPRRAERARRLERKAGHDADVPASKAPSKGSAPS